MTITLSPSSQIPRQPEDVELKSYTAQPYPDGKRVALTLTFTPFQQPPSAEIEVHDPAGNVAAHVNIIGSTDAEIRVVVHLRGESLPGTYTATARAFYLDDMPLPADGPENRQPAKIVPLGEAKTTFTV